jgi:hypothetical protein
MRFDDMVVGFGPQVFRYLMPLGAISSKVVVRLQLVANTGLGRGGTRND